jgi:Fic family protein
MQVDRFESSPIGHLLPISGEDARLKQSYTHFAFVPDPLPHQVQLGQRTYRLLSEADRALGGLNAKVELLPNPRLLVRPALTREAVATSALEGTFAPLSEVLEAEYTDPKRSSNEVREIRNYISAATQGLKLIGSKPICLNLLSDLQKVLVRGTRGDSYDAGQLRKRQVCIGDEGVGIEGSRFVPPPPGEDLQLGMDQWEKWLYAESDLPLLVKAALAHYQFETLHPFSDGNGRLGRLVVTLQLIDAGALDYPILNLSPWLEPRRTTYIDHLLAVSETGNFDPWVAFFAEGVKARAAIASETISNLLTARQTFLDQLRGARCRGAIVNLAGDLIGYPIINISDAMALTGVTYPAASTAVWRLVELGVLTEITGRDYDRIFRCDKVYEIIDNA